MSFSLKFRERLDDGTADEIDKLMKFLKQFLLLEHNEDGTHIVAAPTTNTAPADAQYVTVGNTSALSKERALTGTANQVTVTDNGANSTVQLGLPQSIATGSSPEFTNLTLSGTTASRLVSTNGSKVLASVANLASWVAGTANQVTVTDDGDGSVTLATPQNIHTTASPTFTAVTLSGLTSGRVPVAGTGGLLGDDADLTFVTDTLTATKIVGSTSITDSGLTSGRVVVAGTAGILTDDADLTFATDTLTTTKVVASTDLTLGGAAAAATTARSLTKKVTGISDNVATDVLTVTIPNANHAAAIKLTFLSSNGSTDAFESSRVATGHVVVARTTGANAVTVAAAIDDAAIATVSGGATHTLAYSVSAITGAAGASNSFTIQVTIDDSGNLGSSQVVILAELINSESTGITIS